MADHSKAPRWDAEISVRWMVWICVSLLLTGALAALSMYFLQTRTQDGLEARDAAPRPVAQAIADPRVGPQLQMNPDLDLVALRAHDRGVLESWAWVDREQGVVRMPVADALEWVADHGIEAATVAVATAPAVAEPEPLSEGELVP